MLLPPSWSRQPMIKIGHLLQYVIEMLQAYIRNGSLIEVGCAFPLRDNAFPFPILYLLRQSNLLYPIWTLRLKYSWVRDCQVERCHSIDTRVSVKANWRKKGAFMSIDRTISSHIVCVRGHLLYKAGTHIFKSVLKLNSLCYSHSILCDLWRPIGLLNNNISSLQKALMVAMWRWLPSALPLLPRQLTNSLRIC